VEAERGLLMYVVTHLTETDGDVEIGCCKDRADVEKYVDEHELHPDEYAVIEGVIVKDFFNKTW